MHSLGVLRGHTDEELEECNIFELGAVIYTLEPWLARNGGEGLQSDLGRRRGFVFDIDAGFQENGCYFCYGRHYGIIDETIPRSFTERESITYIVTRV